MTLPTDAELRKLAEAACKSTWGYRPDKKLHAKLSGETVLSLLDRIASLESEIAKLKAFIGCEKDTEVAKGVLAVGQALIDKDAEIAKLKAVAEAANEYVGECTRYGGEKRCRPEANHDHQCRDCRLYFALTLAEKDGGK